jgi:phage shock protein A
VDNERIDTVLQNLQNHLSSLDNEVTELVRNQEKSNAQAQAMVVGVRKEIKTLISKIRAIRTKASQSEDLVTEMTNGGAFNFRHQVAR